MKLKFINSVVAAAVIIGAAGCFSSCKDTDEDIFMQIKDQNATMQQKLEKDIEALRGQYNELNGLYGDLKKAQEACKDSCDKKWKELQQAIKDSASHHVDWATYNAHLAEFGELTGRVGALENAMDSVKAVLTDNGKYDLAGRFVAIETNIDRLNGSVDSLKDCVDSLVTLPSELRSLSSRLDVIGDSLYNLNALVLDVQKTANNAYNLAVADSIRLDAIDLVLDTLKANDAALMDSIIEHRQEIQALKADLADYKIEAAKNLQAVQEALQQQIDGLDGKINLLTADVKTLWQNLIEMQDQLFDLTERVEANEKSIKKINEKIDEISGRLNKLEDRVSNLENRISGIVIQQVSNPVIGSISTPFDLQSLILFNYYGEAFDDVNFPNFSNAGNNYGQSNKGVNTANLKMADKMSLAQGERFLSSEDDFGTVYFTVNPANVSLDGKNFTLVNSKDEESVIKLDNVKPADKELTFGISRAEASEAAANGFYQADAVLSIDDIDAVALRLDSDLKVAVKDALKERKLGNFAEVANLVYKQFNGKVPALALKGAWSETVEDVTTDYAVYSQYAMAGATFRPLSFATAFGSDFSSRIPVMPSFDRVLDKVQFDFTGLIPEFKFSTEKFTINTDNINFSLNLNATVSVDIDTIKVEVVIPPVDVLDTAGKETGFKTAKGTATGVVTNMEVLNDSVAAAIERAFKTVQESLSADIEAQFKDAIQELANQINSQLDDVFVQMQEDVNSYMEDVAKDLQGMVNGKIESVAKRIERYYDRVESIYKRVYNMFKDPNHYMQVMLLYKSNNYIGRLSNSKAMPTVFKGNGTAVTLLPTTYNAELITPCYKKYVAVTNVYNIDGSEAANAASLIKAANGGRHMDEVFQGRRQTVAFDFAQGRGKNLVYEITYQGLDYHGMTSTQKFYVNIK